MLLFVLVGKTEGDAVGDSGEWLKYHQTATALFGNLYWTFDTDGTGTTDGPMAEPGSDSGACNGDRKSLWNLQRRAQVALQSALENGLCPRHTKLDGSQWGLRRRATASAGDKLDELDERTDGTDGGAGNRLFTAAW
ncbi:hypothetical protein F442_19477 [Phytophthora nicotianae P10297]|uniref:Uncharacterized protein n=2 Tax=Phytophthora nicotianae TaxID=4792 RepID=W2Y9C8_PHYNI|nr:hypothetical protein F442_19477 [Phytophthora nicotianae P10297]